MSVLRWLGSTLQPASAFARSSPWDWFRDSGRPRPQSPRYRPVLHGLEDRCLLSTFNEFLLPPPVVPVRIAAGGDGNLWFTDDSGVSQITPDGQVTLDLVAGGIDVASDASGNIWTLDFSGDSTDLLRISPHGSITGVQLPSRVRDLQGIAGGPDGSVWATYESHDLVSPTKIARIAPDGSIAEFTIADESFYEVPVGGTVTVDPQGNAWFVESVLEGFGVARMTPEGVLTQFGRGQEAFSIAAGPDGSIWATIGNGIERITPDGSVSVFSAPANSGITAGPDGNMWFTAGAFIDSITPDGHLTAYATSLTTTAGITTGPDGNIWVTGSVHSGTTYTGAIGQLVLNDGGTAARGPTANLTPLAQAAHSAAVDALFAGPQPDQFMPAIGSQPAELASVDPASVTSRSEASATPKPQQTVADPGAIDSVQPDSGDATHVIGSVDPLTGGLG